jgi:hypothetical protein
MNVIAVLLVLLVFVANTSVMVMVEGFGRKRAARVKIGTHYKQDDPVHIIVNKIGYVIFSLCQ